MKRVLSLLVVLLIGACLPATSVVAEDAPIPVCCCKVVILGATLSCGGFYLPNAYVELQGDLRTKGNYAPYATSSDSLGRYAFMGIVPLSNYWNNKVIAFASLNVGTMSKIWYGGESAPFDVHCFVIGQLVQCNIQVPMWVL